jgi:hypothetical protein
MVLFGTVELQVSSYSTTQLSTPTTSLRTVDLRADVSKIVQDLSLSTVYGQGESSLLTCEFSSDPNFRTEAGPSVGAVTLLKSNVSDSGLGGRID